MVQNKQKTYNRRKSGLFYCLLGMVFQLFSSQGMTQSLPGFSFEIKKPKIYETRTLPSEKTGQKNFTAPRRFYNNLVSRFNYYFNANAKLNEALEKAKEVHLDDYTQLLSFYNYSLDETAKGEIDTIIYKCSAGILLHDLRSDWVDKLYLLMGKAYLYRKDFDSASNVFTYINYAFSPKDNGYDIPLGSNASNTNGVFTISTREKTSTWKKIASFPPSRNESFMLQARTYTEQGQFTEAEGLLELIRTDPNFPERLRVDFHEMSAFLYYRIEQYEKAGNNLILALDNASTNSEKARWEYLTAQLYQLAKVDNKAILLFERSIQHTNDPLLEVYARMNIVSLSTANQDNAIQKNLDELLKMAKRDKYITHRDIIYYAAAELELKRKNYAAAQKLLLNSVKYSVNNPLQKQLSFLLLGDMNYPLKHYSDSHKYYDSIQTSLLKEDNKIRVEERKPALKIISENEEIIKLEDSLQKIALLSKEQRDIYLKTLLKRLRKEKGLKDDDKNNLSFGNSPAGSISPANDLFSNNPSDFYFLNTSLKARGSTDFKSRWGNRPNVDNWRRQTAINNSLTKAPAPTGDKIEKGMAKKDIEPTLDIESLSKKIPLTVAQTDSSHKSIIKALMENAFTFQNVLEDYPSAVETYEELMRRYPESSEVETALFNLSYCYKKIGKTFKADSLVSQLTSGFSTGKYAAQLKAGNTPKINKKEDPAQIQYENVYGLFLAGKFDEAKEAKLKADKQFGKNYWTPQLLYIESIYYIKQKEDSIAINRLENIVSLFSKSPLAEKATTMIDVLKRRDQIEYYLINLKTDQTQEVVSRGVDLNSAVPLGLSREKKKDTLLKAPTELKVASKELVDLSNTKTITTAAVITKDSAKLAMPKDLKKIDIANIITAAPVDSKTFTFSPSDTQYVVVLLNNVDPIFITESRNAFNRYNQNNYSSQRIELSNRKINGQYNFLMFGPFPNASEAIGYIDRTRPQAKTQIIPWLTTDKYSFSIISNANMAILINTNDIEGYHTFIQKLFPDKF